MPELFWVSLELEKIVSDDFCLRNHPMYKHIFEDKSPAAKPQVKWLKPGEGFVNSQCGRWQVRKHGDPAEYELYNIRIVPFARLIKSGFKSMVEVGEFLQRQS